MREFVAEQAASEGLLPEELAYCHVAVDGSSVEYHEDIVLGELVLPRPYSRTGENHADAFELLAAADREVGVVQLSIRQPAGFSHSQGYIGSVLCG